MSVTRFRDEQGGVLLITSLAMLALVLIVAFVVDVGNWKEHKRHLQLQADASALAGAGSFALPACNDTTVANAARDYAGSDATYLAKYNDQVASKYDGAGHIPNMHILINSIGYYGDTGAGNNTGGSPCATSPPNSFCNGAQGIDIKATETDLPWFFGGLVPKIHAHARVCLMQQTSSANSLPIAVPNPKPKHVAAIFVDYGNGLQVKEVADLTECTGVGCPTSLNVWSNPGGKAVPLSAQTGVIIAISGRPDPNWSGNIAAICGQPLTTCFDATNDPSTVGVDFIRGWSGSGSGTQPDEPVLREVRLFQGDCPADPYFQAITANCNVMLAAVVDAHAPDGSDLTGMGIKVTGAGCPNKGCDLTKNTDVPPPPECAAVLGNGATGKCWHGLIPIRAKQGAQQLVISWNESRGTVTGQGDCTKGNGCNGTFPGTAQQAYTADDLPTHNISGPLAAVSLTTCDGDPSCLTPANSLPLGTRNVQVTLGLKGALRNAQNAADATASCTFDDGSVHQFACLKVTVTNAGSGSTQSINCDPLASPKKDLDDQLALGCSPQYVINTGTPCPAANILEASPMPWNCTELFTGEKTPMISKGLNRRIYGTANPPQCPLPGFNGHNNWNMFDPTDLDGLPGFPDGDRRVVGVYLTAYGAFTHTSGTSLTIPVTDFGTFYITGYDGSPCQAGLPGADPFPDDPIPNKGTIVGHFIKYVDKLNTGGGTTPCDPNSFGSCVPVMTK
jgi:Putative Flp pilus-assembly TadE/G-like